MCEKRTGGGDVLSCKRGEEFFNGRAENLGHFAAWEVPELLVGDVREMFGKGGGAYGCVEGKSGYDDE